jgi:hypothetical protein
MQWMQQPMAMVPVHYFALSFDCRYLASKEIEACKGVLGKEYHVPSSAAFCGEDPFAAVSMAWNQQGLAFSVEVQQPVKHSCYPNIEQGDSVQLFIDTRDIKSSGYNTRFCHEFFFLAQEVDGWSAGESTHFRGDDSHSLCDPALLQRKVKVTSTGYTMQMVIPASCLHGYDPDQFDRLGFTYRINRAQFFPQHFSASSFDYQIEQQPSLWASCRLIRS